RIRGVEGGVGGAGEPAAEERRIGHPVVVGDDADPFRGVRRLQDASGNGVRGAEEIGVAEAPIVTYQRGAVGVPLRAVQDAKEEGGRRRVHHPVPGPREGFDASAGSRWEPMLAWFGERRQWAGGDGNPPGGASECLELRTGATVFFL